MILTLALRPFAKGYGRRRKLQRRRAIFSLVEKVVDGPGDWVGPAMAGVLLTLPSLLYKQSNSQSFITLLFVPITFLQNF